MLASYKLCGAVMSSRAAGDNGRSCSLSTLTGEEPFDSDKVEEQPKCRDTTCSPDEGKPERLERHSLDANQTSLSFCCWEHQLYNDNALPVHAFARTEGFLSIRARELKMTFVTKILG